MPPVVVTALNFGMTTLAPAASSALHHRIGPRLELASCIEQLDLATLKIPISRRYRVGGLLWCLICHRRGRHIILISCTRSHGCSLTLLLGWTSRTVRALSNHDWTRRRQERNHQKYLQNHNLISVQARTNNVCG